MPRRNLDEVVCFKCGKSTYFSISLRLTYSDLALQTVIMQTIVPIGMYQVIVEVWTVYRSADTMMINSLSFWLPYHPVFYAYY